MLGGCSMLVEQPIIKEQWLQSHRVCQNLMPNLLAVLARPFTKQTCEISLSVWQSPVANKAHKHTHEHTHTNTHMADVVHYSYTCYLTICFLRISFPYQDIIQIRISFPLPWCTLLHHNPSHDTLPRQLTSHTVACSEVGQRHAPARARTPAGGNKTLLLLPLI